MSKRLNGYRQALLVASGIAAALGSTVGPVRAQTAPVEEVVVTAERRATDLQKTPLAITAVSAETLDKSNVTHLADVNGLVPSLEVTKSAGFETIVTIRGIGDETPENALTTSPGVALFIDGAYVANSVSLDQTLADIDHVEVLRGPQGALYGESATGGAIIIVTKQPDLDGFSGSVEGSYGTYNLIRTRAELNIPLADTFAVRMSVQQFSHDGFTKDPLIPGYHPDDADDLEGKFAALWKPTSNFQATITTQFYHAYQDAAAQKNINDLDPNPYEITQDFGPKFDMATNLTHLNVEWDEPWFTLKSVTAYQWLDNVQGEDSSRSAVSILHAYDDVAAWDTSLQNYNEELDIQSNGDSDFDWTAGVFLLSQHSDQFVEEFECSGAYGPCAPPTPAQITPQLSYEDDLKPAELPGNLDYGNASYVNRDSWAIFAQGTYHITSALSATAGIRLNGDTYYDHSHNFSAFAVDSVAHSFSDHVPTGRLQLDYQATPDNLLYVSAARGYKPGGVNGIYGQSYNPATCTNPFSSTTCNPLEQLVVPNVFKPEINTAYEIGSKNNFFDNHLTANFAAFYYVYQDMQYIATDPVPFDGGMTNIPSTHIWGGEAEVHYVGLENRFHFNGDISLENGAIQGNYKAVDSTVSNTIESTNPNCAFGGQYYNPYCWLAVVAGARDVGGDPPAKLPTVLGAFDTSYDFAIPTGTLTPRFQFVYRGSFWARIFDEPALDKVPSYSVVNLYLEYVPDNSAFKLSITATNVGNVAGVNSRYTDPYGTGQTSQQFIAPRQVFGTISYAF